MLIPFFEHMSNYKTSYVFFQPVSAHKSMHCSESVYDDRIKSRWLWLLVCHTWTHTTYSY